MERNGIGRAAKRPLFGRTLEHYYIAQAKQCRQNALQARHSAVLEMALHGGAKISKFFKENRKWKRKYKRSRAKARASRPYFLSALRWVKRKARLFKKAEKL